jgi:hypothetical protein
MGQNEPISDPFLGQVLKELPADKGQNGQKGGSKHDHKKNQNIPKGAQNGLVLDTFWDRL